MSGRPLKIAYVITRADVIGGASIHLLDLAMGAKYAGHDVTVFAGGEGILMDHLQMLAIDHVSLKHMQRELRPVQDVCSLMELRRKLAALKPDIVHCHSSKAGVVGRLAARSLSIPVVFTAHGWAFTEGVSERRRKLYRIIERVMARFSDHIITVSDYDRNLALKNKVGKPALITTIHNGVHDVAERRPDVPASLPLKLIMVARFDPPKDQVGLLRDVATLDPDTAVLELVGEGTELNQARQTAAELGLSGRVKFTGWRPDIAQCLARSDVFVLNSKWEGLPLSILEAMRAGLPVIASDVGGINETVDDGETGILVRRDDANGFAHAIVLLAEHLDLIQQMGQKGRQKYEREFRFRTMLGATLHIYRRISNRPSCRADKGQVS